MMATQKRATQDFGDAAALLASFAFIELRHSNSCIVNQLRICGMYGHIDWTNIRRRSSATLPFLPLSVRSSDV
jgi:hypothetical protein